MTYTYIRNSGSQLVTCESAFCSILFSSSVSWFCAMAWGALPVNLKYSRVGVRVLGPVERRLGFLQLLLPLRNPSCTGILGTVYLSS